MPDRLFRLYQRKRIININVNIVTAGMVAIALSKAVVWVLSPMSTDDTTSGTDVEYWRGSPELPDFGRSGDEVGPPSTKWCAWT